MQLTVRVHTHEHSLTFLLHEEELSPVGGCGFYPKNHQVAEGQHPQEGRGEELTQGALTVAWWVQAEAEVHTERTVQATHLRGEPLESKNNTDWVQIENDEQNVNRNAARE